MSETSAVYAMRWRDDKIVDGLCPRCGGIKAVAGIICVMCRDGLLQPRQNRVQGGGCYDCSRPAAAGRKRCTVCLANKKTRLKKLREQAISGYGGRCMCPGGCAQQDPRFLTFDHVDNDGAQHRTAVSASMLPAWCIKNGFPSSIRLLCYNCNCARRLGQCPHELDREAAIHEGKR